MLIFNFNRNEIGFMIRKLDRFLENLRIVQCNSQIGRLADWTEHEYLHFLRLQIFFHAVRNICVHRTLAGFFVMLLGLLFWSRKQLLSELCRVGVLSLASFISIFHLLLSVAIVSNSNEVFVSTDVDSGNLLS